MANAGGDAFAGRLRLAFNHLHLNRTDGSRMSPQHRRCPGIQPQLSAPGKQREKALAQFRAPELRLSGCRSASVRGERAGAARVEQRRTRRKPRSLNGGRSSPARWLANGVLAPLNPPMTASGLPRWSADDAVKAFDGRLRDSWWLSPRRWRMISLAPELAVTSGETNDGVDVEVASGFGVSRKARLARVHVPGVRTGRAGWSSCFGRVVAEEVGFRRQCSPWWVSLETARPARFPRPGG